MPEPGEYDEVELLAAIRAMLARGRAAPPADQSRALYQAYADACAEDEHHGNLAGLILYWIIGGHSTAERLTLADEILNGSSANPRRAAVQDVVHRIGAGEISWDEFAKITKKGLIPKERPIVPAPPPEALLLQVAKRPLEEMLGDTAEVSAEAAWRTFAEYASLPVAVKAPLYIESDMCLFQWGSRDAGGDFECDFTRQFVLDDLDGDYDHMEQVSLTLLFDARDADTVAVGSGAVWSGDDLLAWQDEVSTHEVLRVLGNKPAKRWQLEHSEV
jgi:hypothetical protein